MPAFMSGLMKAILGKDDHRHIDVTISCEPAIIGVAKLMVSDDMNIVYGDGKWLSLEGNVSQWRLDYRSYN